MARLLGIRIKNYKALADLKLGQVAYASGDALPSLVCFIGPNGSGKSTLLDAFGFIADCLLENVEAACDKPWRGGFDRLRTQGQTGAIEFELWFEADDPVRPIVYLLHIDERDGVPRVVKETLRQRRKGETVGKPYHFLKLVDGKGRVWSGDVVQGPDEKESIPVHLTDTGTLGITTLGNLAEHPRIVRLRTYIEQWYLSYFVPEAARSLPATGAQRYLDRAGSNIGNVLQYFQRQHSAEFTEILARLTKAIPGLKRISTEISTDKRLLIRFDEEGYADPFYQQSMSDGTLKMLAYAILLADPDPRPFIGIEEPENGLYVHLLEHLAQQLLDHSKSKVASSQVLVTTHSPYFVDALSPQQVWLIRKDQQGHSKAYRAANDPQVVSLVNEGLPLGSLWYSNHLANRDR